MREKTYPKPIAPKRKKMKVNGEEVYALLRMKERARRLTLF